MGKKKPSRGANRRGCGTTTDEVAMQGNGSTAGKRGAGEGTWEALPNGRWRLRTMIGRDPNGRRLYREFRGATQAECRAAMRAWQSTREPPPKVTPLPVREGPDGREFVRLADPQFRRWIYERDEGICQICREPVSAEDFHVDHIRPRIEGGSDRVGNLRISHSECNLLRNLERRLPIYV
jgi:5-methylcytosine-specific restriction endonuclease McrA